LRGGKGAKLITVMAGKRETQARIRVKRLKHHLQDTHTPNQNPSLGQSSSSNTDEEDNGYREEEDEGEKRMDQAELVVVGGSVMDVHLSCDRNFIEGSTVPGRVAFRHGGVGRNIAECLGRLRQRPLFISAVGSDGAGREILRALESRGVSTRGVKVCQGRTTSMVACSFDAKGNLTNGVADTSLVEEEVDCQWVRTFQKEIEHCKLLVLEANLHPQTLQTCAEIAHRSLPPVPVFYEPVSVTKSVRVLPLLSKVTYLSPNEAELSAIANAIEMEKKKRVELEFKAVGSHSLFSEGWNSSARGGNSVLPAEEVARQARLVRSLGAKNVLVTRGKDGVYAATEDGEALVVPSLEIKRVANVNGAGDCLVAGILKALAGGNRNSVHFNLNPKPTGSGSNSTATLEYAVSYGIAVACAAIQSPLNVPEIGDNFDEIDANALQVFSNRIATDVK
jgi:sugar/nucleoside kinase (ribokinase family)